VAFLVAVPTLVIPLNNQYRNIRGIEPSDINANWTLNKFAFAPSLDLQGGKIYTFNVDLSQSAPSERPAQLELIRNIIDRRLLSAHVGYYQLNSYIDEVNSKYKLIIKVPEIIDDQIISLITTPGNVSVWVEDSSISATDTKAQQNAQFGGRKQTNISNDDFSGAEVTSDARCYFGDAGKPLNFCVRLTYKNESKLKFESALYSSPTGRLPMLYVVDGAAIAGQAAGQVFSSDPGTQVLLYYVVPDNFQAKSALAALLSGPALNGNVTQESTNNLSPTLGINTLVNVKVSLLVSFVAANLLLLFYFRKRSLFIIIINVLTLIWSICLLKIYNAPLELSLVVGYILGFSFFETFVLLLMYRIRNISGAGISKEELAETYEKSNLNYRNFTVFIVIVSLIIYFFTPLVISNFATGVTFAVVTGLIIFIIAVRALLPFQFLTKTKK
jgi:preprotein translocase subunit SecF